MKLHMELGSRGYDILIERGILAHAAEEWKLDRRVLIVTDEGVPEVYSRAIAAQCACPVTERLPQGEATKSLSMLERLLSRMLREGFTRTDCVVAVGGGVIGDLAGFAASCYMRGVDFYNLPTTLLSQIDSSIGGKTAVNLGGVKNCVGAFYQPKKVLIDPDTLVTLPQRQVANGLAEAVKMSLTFDPELFRIFEEGKETEALETVILRSLSAKKAVVEADERESGARRVLNFGHTLGHGIEAAEQLHGLYHGECVALGMIPMCAESVRARLLPVLTRLGLPTRLPVDPERVLDAVCHDKKCEGQTVAYVWVPEVGQSEIRRVELEEFRRTMLPRLQEMTRKGESAT